MKNMKRLFTVLLVSLLCVHIASAQTRATRRSEFKIIDPADTVKIQIKKPGCQGPLQLRWKKVELYV